MRPGKGSMPPWISQPAFIHDQNKSNDQERSPTIKQFFMGLVKSEMMGFMQPKNVPFWNYRNWNKFPFFVEIISFFYFLWIVNAWMITELELNVYEIIKVGRIASPAQPKRNRSSFQFSIISTLVSPMLSTQSVFWTKMSIGSVSRRHRLHTQRHLGLLSIHYACTLCLIKHLAINWWTFSCK